MSKEMQLNVIMAASVDPSVSASTATMNKQIATVGVATDKTNAKQIAAKKAANERFAARSWKDFNKAVKDTGSSLGKVKSEIWGVAKAAAGLVAGNGLLGASIYGIAKSSANYADSATKEAQGLGLTTEAYTELAYAATMAGTSEQQFAMASGKVSKLITDAAAGNDKALDIFSRTGISIRDSAGQLKDVEQLWGDFSDVFASMPDGIGKTRLAIDMFGEQGAKLIPFLNSSKKGMDAAREAAKNMGLTLSKQDGMNAEAFNDSFANIGHSIRGVSLIAGKHLWPVFTEIHDYISSKIVLAGQELAKVMPEWSAAFKDGWKALVPELENAWETIKAGALYINDLAKGMGGWVPLIKSVVKYWLVWRGIRLGKSLYDTGKAVKDLGSKFFDLQRNGTTLGAWLKKQVKGLAAIPKDGLKPFASSLRKGLSGVFSGAYSAVSSAVKGAGSVIKGFSRATWDGIAAAASFSKTLLASAGKGVVSFASTIAAKALPMLSGFATALYAGAAAAVKFGAALLLNPIGLAIAGIVALGGAIYLCVKHWDKIKAAVSAAWNSIKSVFVAGWNLLPDWVQGPILKVVNAVASFGQKIWTGIKKDWDSIAGVFTVAWDGIVNVVDTFGGMLSDAFSTVWASVSGIFIEKFDAIGSAFENSFIGGLLETAKQFNPLNIFMDAFTRVKDWLMSFDLAQAGAELARKLGDGVMDTLSGIGESVKSAIVGWIPGGESIVNAAGAAKDAVSGAASTAWNAVTGFFSGGGTEAVPAMANGGVVTRPQLTLIGEAGPEVVIPVTRAARARELMSKAAEMIGMSRDADAPRSAAPLGGGIMRNAAAAGLTALLSIAPAAAASASMPDVNLHNSITTPAGVRGKVSTVEYSTIINNASSRLGDAISSISLARGGDNNAASYATDSLTNFLPVISNLYGGDQTATTYSRNQSRLSNITNAAGNVSALNTWFGDTADAATSSTISAIYGGDTSNVTSSYSKVGGDLLRNIINTVTLAEQSVPAFADGGFVDAPQLALVGEAGPEMIVPLTRENRARGLMSAAAEFMGWSGGGEGGGNTFHFTFSPTVRIEGGDKNTARQVEQQLDQQGYVFERKVRDVVARMLREEQRTRNDC